jgi:hypothetical protein
MMRRFDNDSAASTELWPASLPNSKRNETENVDKHGCCQSRNWSQKVSVHKRAHKATERKA